MRGDWLGGPLEALDEGVVRSTGGGPSGVSGDDDGIVIGWVAACAFTGTGGGCEALTVCANPSDGAAFCRSGWRSDGGGGGGALARGAFAGARVEFFFPSPSNTSRSEPPLLSPPAMSADLLELLRVILHRKGFESSKQATSASYCRRGRWVNVCPEK